MICGSRKETCLFRLLLLCTLPMCATVPDTLSLSAVEVVGRAPLTRLHRDNSLNFDALSLSSAPRTLGESDALNYLRLLPGVNTISDYSAGISIDGMDYAANQYLLDGIPVLFPYHFGGIFSTFSPSLYPRTAVAKSIRPARSADCLGGIISVCSPRPHTRDSVWATANAGMLASSVAAGMPLGHGLAIAASARVSYVEMLYRRLLESDNGSIDFGFRDFDLTATWAPDATNTLRVTAHYNRDRLAYRQMPSELLSAMRWHNALGGLEWSRHGDRCHQEHRVYHSSFANRLGMTVSGMGAAIRNRFAQTAIEGHAVLYVSPSLTLAPGYALTSYCSVPQTVESHGVGSEAPAVATERACQASASLDIAWQRGDIRLSAGSRLSYFGARGGYRRAFADPYAGVLLDRGRFSLNLSVASTRQYVHQVGLSEVGMASNFRLCADEGLPAQHAWNFTIAARGTPRRGLSLGGDVFYKIISRQPEYTGSILEMVSADYSPRAYVRPYDGYNAGGSVMLSYSGARVDGTASYSFCLAQRRDPATGTYFTASSEVRHSAKLHVVWRIGRHWEASGVFSLSSGRPYTPIEAVYMIGERVMMEYGARNSATMPLYHRLDLGGAYKFETGGRHRLRHRVDISLLNAYARRNIELYTYTFNSTTLRFRRREICSLYSTLPSLSYTLSF